MTEFIYVILCSVFGELEPFDVVHMKNDQFYLTAYDLIISFNSNTTEKYSSKYVAIVHDRDEAPNLQYLNYYPNNDCYEDAYKIVCSIFKEFGIKEKGEPFLVSQEEAKRAYDEAVSARNDYYRTGIIKLLSSSDELFYPPEESSFKNWFEMQPTYYTIEYNYNGKTAYIVNDSVYGNWGYFFSAASKYLAVSGKEKISQRCVWNGVKIGGWLSDQKTAYKGGNGHVSPERKELLNKIYFSVNNTFEVTFEKNLSLLTEYLDEYGHCNPEKREVYKNEKLGIFCQRMRKERKRGKLKGEREEKLNAIGFDWDPLETEWCRRFGQYKRYIEENGGKAYIARRTSYEGENLGAWVETQRKWYKQGKMSETRYRMMKEIAPDFETNSADS